MTREEMLYFLSSVGVNEHKLIQTQQRIRVIDQEKAKLGQKRLFEAPPEKENVGKAAIHGIGDAFWALAPATIIVGVMALAAIVIMLLEVIPSLFGIGDYTISSLLYGALYLVSWPLRHLAGYLGLPSMPDRFQRINDIEVADFISCIIYSIITVGVVVFLYTVFSSIRRRMKYGSETKRYQNNLRAFEVWEEMRLEREGKEKAVLQKERAILSTIEQRCLQTRQKAYAMGILPGDYWRLDIIAVFYRYFLNGAVDTMKEAINKYDLESRLDRIELKLDQVLRNQQNILSSLYETQHLAASVYTQNRQMMSQNRQVLSYAQESAYNSRVAAVCSEVSATLAIYDQLYQK